MSFLRGIGIAAWMSVICVSVGAAHDIKEKIADCTCDTACFTDEVQNLSCTATHFSFSSHGLPDASHKMMVGITGNNQQFPSSHNLEFSLPRHPERASSPTATRPGAIGVAVNGVPIFDPGTQGPVRPETGKPVSAADAGELDICGGHAGRGDDYHYHRAPNCLIDEMGAEAVETQHRPIGYASDGFPILALGWFDKANDIEAELDRCRGATDGAGAYFYNVQHQGEFAVLDCLSGTEQRFARDHWDQRKDQSGHDIVGIPIKFAVDEFTRTQVGKDQCAVMTGTLGPEKLLRSDGSIIDNTNLDGALFHCSNRCYGQFVEAPWNLFSRGRVLVFETATSGCPAGFAPAHYSNGQGNPFLAFAPAK